MDDLDEELWRPVPGFDGRYSVSSHGNVISHREAGDQLLSPNYRESSGRVNLYNGSATRSFRVAVMVMLAFVGPKPDGHEIVFRDGDRGNARLDNLAYVPVEEIVRALPGDGALAKRRSGLTADQARAIAASSDKAADVARDYGIPHQTVNRIRQGRLWAEETADVRRATYQRRPGTVLTEAEVAEILRAPGTHRELAKQYEVHESTISNIRRGRLWAHMPRPESE